MSLANWQTIGGQEAWERFCRNDANSTQFRQKTKLPVLGELLPDFEPGYTPDDAIKAVTRLGRKISRSTITRYEKDGLLPPPVARTGNRTFYPKEAIPEAFAATVFRQSPQKFKPELVAEVRRTALSRLAEPLKITVDFDELLSDLPTWWLIFRGYGQMNIPLPPLGTKHFLLSNLDVFHNSYPREARVKEIRFLQSYMQSAEREYCDTVLMAQRQRGSVLMYVRGKTKWHTIYFPSQSKTAG